jgi:hypothetical protein
MAQLSTISVPLDVGHALRLLVLCLPWKANLPSPRITSRFAPVVVDGISWTLTRETRPLTPKRDYKSQAFENRVLMKTFELAGNDKGRTRILRNKKLCNYHREPNATVKKPRDSHKWLATQLWLGDAKWKNNSRQFKNRKGSSKIILKEKKGILIWRMSGLVVLNTKVFYC